MYTIVSKCYASWCVTCPSSPVTTTVLKAWVLSGAALQPAHDHIYIWRLGTKNHGHIGGLHG